VTQIETLQPVPDPTVTFGDRIDLAVSFLRRRYPSIIVGMLICLPLGALYHYSSPATYTASSTVMMESQRGLLQESIMGRTTNDAGWIESQIGVLKSQNVAAYVVKQLRLAEDSAFTGIGSAPNLFDRILARLGWGEERKSEAEQLGAAIYAMQSGLDVRRVGQSYMLRIDFRGGNAGQAAKIANAMVDAYVFCFRSAQCKVSGNPTGWRLAAGATSNPA